MSTMAITVALGATALLLVSGYLFGVRAGRAARRALGDRAESFQTRVEHLEAQLAQAGGAQREEFLADIRGLMGSLADKGQGLAELQEEVARLTASLGREGGKEEDAREYRAKEQKQVRELRRALEPILEREQRAHHFQARLETLLGPILAREKLASDLANLTVTSATSRGLVELLERLAERGSFESVLLSDESGLPLVASENTKNADAMAGVSSLLMILADRIPRHGLLAPDAFVLRDRVGKLTMHRIFAVGEKRYLLTVVSEDRNLSPDLFDGVVGKLETLLGKERGRLAAS